MATGRSISNALDVRPALMSDTHDRFAYCKFLGLPNGHATATPFGDPTGTAGNVNTLHMDGVTFQYHVVGTQTILGPKRVDAGLDISQDLTDNDGVEYTLGCEDPADTVIADTANATRGTFKVGTDKPFYVSVKLKITDVSGTDNLQVGLRKAEAYQADPINYDELASLNVVSGDINTDTIINGAANVTTDSTDNWADAAEKFLTVIVDSDGSLYGTARRVYYEIAGVKPTTLPTAAFSFDNTELVIPFVHLRHDSDVAESTIMEQWESGFVGVGQAAFPASQ